MHALLFDKNYELVYEPTAGDDVQDCLNFCAEAAKREGRAVTLRNFNGIDVRVMPGMTADEAYAHWDAAMARRDAEYTTSPEGLAAAAKRAAQIIASQATIDRLLTFMDVEPPPHLSGVVSWLAEFAAHADDVGMKYDCGRVVAWLEGLGYVDNAHVVYDENDHAKGANYTLQEMGEYIVGQAMSCLKSGLPPHPILMRFAAEYAKRAAAAANETSPDLEAEREAYLKENALAEIHRRDDKIARMRRELSKLNKRVQSYRQLITELNQKLQDAKGVQT